MDLNKMKTKASTIGSVGAVWTIVSFLIFEDQTSYLISAGIGVALVGYAIYLYSKATKSSSES